MDGAVDFIQFLLHSADVWYWGFCVMIMIAGITAGLKLAAVFLGTNYNLKRQLRCRHRFVRVKKCRDCEFIERDIDGN